MSSSVEGSIPWQLQQLRVRPSVRGYNRDTYLGSSVDLNSAWSRVDCSVGESQWGVSPRAIEAYAAFDIRRLSAYPEFVYSELLKPAILQRFSTPGLEASQIFFGHGSFNLAERLIHKLIEPKAMLGVGPQFNEIPSEFVAAGGAYHAARIRPPEYVFPLGTLITALMSGGFSCLYLDNPNNPLGRFVGLEDIERLVQTAAEVGVIVVVDEAYGDFLPDSESAIALVPRFPNLAVLRSFSKAFGLAAARIGYMALSSELAKFYTQLDVPFEPSLVSAILARATLDDVDFIEDVRRQAAKTKVRLMAACLGAGLEVLPTDERVPIMTVRKAGIDVARVFALVGILVEPGSVFSQTHSDFDNSYCRIRMPGPVEAELFLQRLPLLRWHT